MLEKDYREISHIIEDIVGDDTVQGVKLLEGIKYYFDKKYSKAEKINKILKESEEAMYRLSKKTLKESENFRKLKKTFDEIDE